ncbi:MAG TPA: sugar nucleotide-binding protein, partial [Thermoanaerobaculia bacterium]|nr:sugar nucleotide-binding protein [Thermoanaerobaculia bacterium]
MRLLVLGAGGMLGQAVVAAAAARGLGVDAAPRAELDVTDPTAVAARMRSAPPALVVNCAAFTQVDGCESEPERAWAVNA